MLTSLLNLYAAVTLGTDQNIENSYIKEDVKPQFEINLPVSMIPVKKLTAIEPVIEADAAIIVDFDSGEILYEKNAKEKLQIASITKLMTVIVALEEGNLEDVVTVSGAASRTEGSKVWLYSGERITLRNLLKAALIQSGNDAAVAIAEHIAGDVPSFVEKMNAKAKELKLYSTHYANPIGFDNVENYSTVSDLSRLAYIAYKNPFIKDTVKLESLTISSTNGEQSHDLKSTNELLSSFLHVLGLKTGHTEAAGLCFVSVIDNKRGNKVITIVLNSPDRFKETKMLATWAFRNYTW